MDRDLYIPAYYPKPDPGPNLKYVQKHGKIIHYGPNDVATVETTFEMIVYFHACRLDEDGTIKEFLRNNINKYVRCKLEKDNGAGPDSSFKLCETDSRHG